MQKARVNNEAPVAMLSKFVSISRQFLRSVRIDSDLGREDALNGYVCQGTAQSLIENMAQQIQETRQRAFTWTGPYGGGKSSLALLLCSLVGSNGVLRGKALEILNPSKDGPIQKVFAAKGNGWLVVPLVGKRAKVHEELSKAFNLANGLGQVKKKLSAPSDVIGDLFCASEQHPQGVLVVIDEMGKFLEATSHEGADLHFFQELAEAASRSSGKLIVVGILHQSFEAYASRLGREARDEWAKVQGRFIDMPMVAAVDEVVELVGRAIESKEQVDKGSASQIARVVTHAIMGRRPVTPPSITHATQRCWPLHPVVATLLGPISRRRFSQNERSTFGFLASREPLGFMEFLETTAAARAPMYSPSRYWDYLKANLDHAILASPDGHRWAVAAEAVERVEAKGFRLHIELTKSVALIELFRGGSGLVPEVHVLNTCIQDASADEVKAALHDLTTWKILIERKHLSAYGVFAGSDFDIEGAINRAAGELGQPDLLRLSSFMDMQPILAKRVYSETGTMRWFIRRLMRVENLEREIESHKLEGGSAGTFLLCLPDISNGEGKGLSKIRKLSDQTKEQGLVLGIPDNADRISELSSELFACEHVFSTRTELDGDSVARKELLGRISAVRSLLEDELSDAFGLTKWYWQGELQNHGHTQTISNIASNIAQAIFHSTPHLNNELINREKPSSNSNRARKDLMYRMLSHANTKDMDYTGYPADKGLYVSILKESGLHRERQDGHFNFGEPYYVNPRHVAMSKLWMATVGYVLEIGASRKASDIYDLWSRPPYGLRQGVMPVLALAFFLANRSTLALYVNGVFTSELTEVVIDEWLLDASSISFNYVSASSDKTAYLKAISDCVPVHPSSKRVEDPLEVARALVALIVTLPNWTKRTTTISADAQAIRAMLLKASDPIKVLFSDLPTILGEEDLSSLTKKLHFVVKEFQESYGIILNTIRKSLLQALDQADGDFSALHKRAKVVKGIAGEFSLEAFVNRLEVFDGNNSTIESLVSLATHKPPAQFVDRDVDFAMMQLASWAHDFRRAETIAPLRGRPSTRRAIGIVFGGGMGLEASISIDIDSKDSTTVSQLATKIIADLLPQSHEVALAALAEAGALLLNAKHREEI
jgi:hypothetical protein